MGRTGNSAIFDFTALSSSLIEPAKVISRSEAASPQPKDEGKDLIRHRTRFEDEIEGGKKAEGDSFSSEDADAPISRKMKDLAGASRAQKRQITTVLMKAPPRSFPASSPGIEDDISQHDFPSNPPLQPIITPKTVSGSNTTPHTPEPEVNNVRERLIHEGECIKTALGLQPKEQELVKEREKVRTLTEEVGKLRMELQRNKTEYERAVSVEKAEVGRLGELVKGYERQVGSQTEDLHRFRSENDSNRKEIAILRQRQDSLYREIQSLTDQLAQHQSDSAAKEADWSGEIRARKELGKGDSEKVTDLLVEIERRKEVEEKLKGDIDYWKRRATFAESDENSSTLKLEAYIRELSSLQTTIGMYEHRLKEQAAAYRALQKEYCCLLDEQTQARNRSISPMPVRKDTFPASSLLLPSLLPSLADGNSEVIVSLSAQMRKYEEEKASIMTAISSIERADTIQNKAKKRTLEMELAMVETNITRIADKLTRCRKTVV